MKQSTVHEAKEAIAFRHAALRIARPHWVIGAYGGLSPTGPREARPDDRLRRNPPFIDHNVAGYACG
jgi:hypothetical protein